MNSPRRGDSASKPNPSPKPCSEGWLAGLNFTLFQIQPESCHLEGREGGTSFCSDPHGLECSLTSKPSLALLNSNTQAGGWIQHLVLGIWGWLGHVVSKETPGRSGKLIKPFATLPLNCPRGQVRLWGCAGGADFIKASRNLVLGQTPSLTVSFALLRCIISFRC